MRVPCVGIDRISQAEMVRVRTKLRAALFSAWTLDNMVVAITGQVDVVRRIAQNASFLAPRVRKLVIDGEELMQARNETPAQYSDNDPLAAKIAKVHGLGRPDRNHLISRLKRAHFDAAYSEQNEAVLIEYCAARRGELDVLIASALAGSEFRQAKGPKGPVVKYQGSLQ